MVFITIRILRNMKFRYFAIKKKIGGSNDFKFRRNANCSDL